jgi:outer membrane protein OmpA-like peptidoglycan-associated protein
MKRRKSIWLLLGTLMCLSGYSQSYIGYGFDNYAGVNTLLLNPGMLADSKYKVNVNILAVSVLAGNNAYEIDRKRLLGLHFSGMHEGDGYYKVKNNAEFKYAYMNTDILGPSAMININSKNAVGIITRMRVMGNEYNLSNSLFQILGNSNPSYANMDIIDRSLQTKLHSFGELGLSFGRVLMKKEHSEFKAGITAKYIAGLGIGAISSGQLLVNIDPLNNINQLNADISTPHTSNFDNLGSGSISDAINKQTGHGWGFDLGVVYEWTPAGNGTATHKDEDEENHGWLSKDVTPYKLRLGLSLTDLGSVNYNNSPNGQTYTMNASGHNSSELQKQDAETYDQYFTRLKTLGLVIPKGGPAKLNVALPTAVHVNVDYHVYKRIFVNGDVLVNMVSTTNLLSPNYTTSFMFTPRLEKKWVSIYAPISYNVESQLNVGAGVRFGPVFVGSGSIVTCMIRNRSQAADFHIGITIPIFKSSKEDKKTDTLYKKINLTHDKDGDGVVDEKDACPDSAGPIALIGCPDKDGDGVPNNKDKCPDVPGSPNFHGCPAPDTDGDSVNDDEDRCPLVKGPASNHGCPPIRPEVLQSVKNAADRIFFVRAKATIEKNCYQELDRVVAILQSDSALHLHIEGHTDTEGTDERNDRLSQRRAKSVKRYLEGKGIPAERMDTKAYGSKRPIAPNETLEGMAQNRRVEMHLTNN